MTLSELQTLKGILPKGWASVLSDKHNLTEDMIRKILRGERKNIPVLDDATSLAENHVSHLKNISRRINKIAV